MGGTVKREKLRTHVRRSQIAEATLAVVGARGLRGLSVAAVARRVGLAPSAIYRHYRSKEDVLDAVVDLIRERLLGNVAAVRAETADPVEALERLLARHIQLIRDNQALPRIVFSEDFYTGHPERRQRVLAAMTGYLDGVAAIIGDGQRRHLIRADIHPRPLAILFLGLIQPAGVLWSLSDGTFDITRQAREAWPVFEQAIRKIDREAAPARPRRKPARAAARAGRTQERTP